jgi:hypothetical protein
MLREILKPGRILGPLIVFLAAICMAAWTWQTWPDVLIDFGLQLYVPWRISQGAVLYRDVTIFTGPLSSYYNAQAFGMFGPSLRVIELANLPILVGILAIVYGVAEYLYGRICAVACGLSFVILFALARLTLTGNYNYVCPYEYEYTHGLFLGMICALLLWRWLQTGKMWQAGAAGFVAGLAFLTRAEFFIAAAGPCLMAFIFFVVKTKPKLLRNIGAAASILGFMLIPPALSIILFSFAMPAKQAIIGTLGNWPGLLFSRVASQSFYREGMGLDHPLVSIQWLGIWSGIYIAAIILPAIWSLTLRGKRAASAPHTIFAAIICGGIAGIATYFYKNDISLWPAEFKPLILIALVCTASGISRFVRIDKTSSHQHRIALIALISTFAFLLLGKIFLDVRIYQYGCWLAMPAGMLLVGLIFGAIPKWISQRGGGGNVFQAGAAGIWITVLAFYLLQTRIGLTWATDSIATDGDGFFGRYDRAPYIDRAVTVADQIIPPDKTLAVMPEGVIINYLSRRKSSIPYLNFNPPDLALYGEKNILDSLRHSSPDYIFLVNKQDSGFGTTYFGRDFGIDLYNWIIQNYTQIQVDADLGAAPMSGPDFGLRLWVRNAEGH